MIDGGIPESQWRSIETHVAEGAAETLTGRVVVDVLATALEAGVKSSQVDLSDVSPWDGHQTDDTSFQNMALRS